MTGVDLSPESIAVATRAAGWAGAHARFRVANAAVDDLESHDVVVLHRVVCCYPDAGVLLANTLPAARSVVAVSLPHSRGARGLVARLLIGVENAWRSVRGDPFRAFVHDEAVVVRMLGRGGFTLTHRRDHVVWSIAIFQRRDRGQVTVASDAPVRRVPSM